MKNKLGFTILLLTVTLLLISTVLILFSAQYSSLQLKITANLYRNQQAFEAAEAGAEAAIPYFQANYSAILAQQSGGYLQPYVNSSTTNVSLANGSSYSFVFSNPIANAFNLISITATGVNQDGSSTRVIKQQIYSYSTGAVPTISSETQGKMSLINTASVNNTQTNANINAGSTVTIRNTAQTTTSSGVSSNASQQGSDITANNNVIASQSSSNFFQNYFGVSSITLQSKANYSYTNISNTNYNNLNGVTGAIIWINQLSNMATIDSTTIVGSQASPVILVVDGNLTISGFATIYGIVFILNPTSRTTISGNVSINGALASTNNIQLNTNATLNYNAPLLYVLPATGAAPSYAKVPASWKDF